MKKIDEDELLAELYVDLKGPKKKRDNWINIAKKCQSAIKIYGSTEEASKKLGVSYELLRSITTLLTLPREVKTLIEERKILYDAAQRLYRISDPQKQIQVARTIAGLPSHTQREIIQYAVKYPNSGLDSFKKRLQIPETRTERIYVVVLPLREKTYRFLERRSARKGTSIEKMVLRIIDESVSRET